MKKIYCYVDETGQDTKGKLFLVSVVLTDKEKDNLFKLCEKIEKESKRGITKWNKTSFSKRIKYLQLIFNNKKFINKIYYSSYEGSKEYVNLTVLTTAKSIIKCAEEDYSATIYVDGLKRTEKDKFARELRKLGIHTEKIQGVKKDENNALIRLADNICGFVRDYLEKQKYTKKLFNNAKINGVIDEI
ncbi:MAG: hypothetical protein ACD_58C00112G0007 [uncultured bacterium]|nr:MAG: hypothetical protein ACD_58C00112G0007 [uncultured bacterium]